LFVFPLLIGENPLEYHRTRLQPANPMLLLGIMGAAFLTMLPAFLIEVGAGWVDVVPRYRFLTTAKKVGRSLLTPLPLALVEEALFRGILLAQLLVVMPGAVQRIVAVVLSAALFASVHFFRPQRRVFLPAVGLFGLGIILGLAYVVAGNAYWLPAAIHAG